jgi:CRP-like cAMP-binding protein
MLNLEQRKHQRIDAVNLFNYVCLDQNNRQVGQGMGRTLNLSESGVLIETPRAIDPQHVLSIHIGLENARVNFKGQVIHSRPSGRIQFRSGIRFLTADKDAYLHFRKHLQGLREEGRIPAGQSRNLNGGRSLPLINGPSVDYGYVVEEETYLPGERIVKEGHFGTWIWVILEGSAHVVRESAKLSIPILKIGPGAFIGSFMTLMARNHSRSATVIASERTQLGLLDTARLLTDVGILSQPFKDILVGLDGRLKRLTDRVVRMRCGMNLANEFIMDGVPLIQQGETDSGLFHITRGKASLIRQTPHGKIPLINLYGGDFVGSLPFLPLGHEPQFASIFSTTDLEKKPLDMAALQKEHQRLPKTLLNMMEHVATGISATSQLVCELGLPAAQQAAAPRLSSGVKK